LDLWGTCGQGLQEADAVAALEHAAARARGGAQQVVAVERIHGDEQAFARDHQPATPAEQTQTLAILRAARQQTLALVSACPDAVLDWDDPQRVLPPWASWRTLRQMAWHVADTESRYYLPRLGLTGRPREADLLEELQRSAAHVQAAVGSVPPALLQRSGGEVWTTTKLLRRLAWHERGELVVMRQLAERARQHLSSA
ncbi:MAG TPA: DinB family protein, partial [Actinomycetes bacterium]|nr:DinB family protein [Actinomycetes bacterium]